MSTVTFILGLCGSGKSHFARQMMQVRVFDESFFGEKQQELKTALQSGENCAVVEIAFCEAEKRWEIEKELRVIPRGRNGSESSNCSWRLGAGKNSIATPYSIIKVEQPGFRIRGNHEQS